ncbi:MAG: DUF4363 family protein [Oscillospiraceae bacterium]|nr:DUF4363 family protein [Oscillospiraceae bacterium]
MKRFWLGVLILLLLLSGSLLINTSMRRIHTAISQDLAEAADAAMAKNWEQAFHLARSAMHRWDRYHRFTAAFADHTPMDDLDALFVQLPVFAQQREDPHFAATCLELSFLATAIAESHRLTWWNLL